MRRSFLLLPLLVTACGGAAAGAESPFEPLGRESQLFILDANRGEIVRATRDQAAHHSLAWSRNGQLAFVSSRSGSVAIEVLAPRTGERRLLLDGQGMTGEGLVWSPDGERLAFTTFVEPSRARIEMVAADGSAHTRIAQFVVPFSSTLGPSWSPDGRRVAYSRGFGTGPPRVAPGNPSNGPAVIPGRLNIVVADASRRTERRLTRSRRSEFDPLWSPRGSEILFGRRIGRERAGLFVAAPGRPERRLAADLVVAPAAWSPDGRTVAFLRVPFFGDRRYHLFVVDVNTRRMRKLADRVATVRPSWSPDGRRIAFAGLDGIRTVSPEGGSSELLVHVREHVGEIAWSPDGVSLAFTVSRIPDD